MNVHSFDRRKLLDRKKSEKEKERKREKEEERRQIR